MASGPVTIAVAVASAIGLGAFFHLSWRSSPLSLAYNVPIAVPFVAFFFDRLLPQIEHPRRLLLVDAAVIGLALLRVFAPPLPFVSGHALFVGYAALSARRSPLRVTAALVAAQVVIFKLFVMGGWASMLGGFALAALAAHVRRRLSHQ
ncbi:MAG TPA: hypothetical protein VGF45_09670 [Polyangia bacterium]